MSLASGPGRGGAVGSVLPDELKLVVDRHVAYIQSLDTRRDELEYHLTEHLRISGIYWGLNALNLLGHPEALPREGLLKYVFQCWNDEKGGFGGAPGHDAHILFTGYSVQIIVLVNGLDELEQRIQNARSKIAKFVASLQRPSGTFAGDEWGETDTRFMFSALYTLSLLNLLPHQQPDQPPLVDMAAATAYIKACHNFDGAFGVAPGAESHSGQVYTCVGVLSIAGELDSYLGESGKDRLGAWLSERQLTSGGLNGRPEKLVDTCYAWWVGSSLAMIGRLHWIDRKKLATFILQCQDPEYGGIADRAEDMVDVFHTHFGVAGLSLLGHSGVGNVDPVYCLPKSLTDTTLIKPRV
ncbi:geranylgeranyl transferase type 2 subunit beta [Teratosphaeria nubilosa]|uniref:Geranylgeranyl transferase type-2 subunit beta n=1 Tax=Teratosphaeria nubilosa TaxID=161662 RepID=A0A6G1L8H1_9PEZI|nr:geranylgeranyl transferase type 2 subunit beta [Teratosphaeria nubilosa]